MIEFDDRTSSQLKNAGGLRLIGNKKVLDTLSHYWEYQKKLLTVGENLKDKKDKMHELEFHIYFDRKFYKNTGKPFEDEVIGNPVLSAKAPEFLPEYINRLSLVRDITKNYIQFISNENEFARNAIVTIRKEYNLENE
jgi:hypothetical protein